ncbi:histidine phosphatase family protein [Cellvibrio polysaccharolyticus]|uniref:Histidine phosphatase family protein n=1 Tax=Cellvibrio polysaccharolyticus TaxID=2082724 RepID=A0A928V4V8_9GAMM|nr:histidine phosphatase family protein [Cellvibrio polysaccharolyticus]MBE8717245.1 histidine phosphatase family protein [Cellvibrio polysaccharolyticus]
MSETFSSTTIDLFRHGEAEGGKIFRGSTDSSLSAAGFEQMTNTIGVNPPRWDAIISSPLSRCSDFAKTLSIQYDVPLYLHSDFREINFGEWEGQLVSDVYEENATAVENFWLDPLSSPPPGAETMKNFQQRVIAGWEPLLTEMRGKHILLVTHGGVVRMILAHILAMPLRPLSRIAVPEAALSRVQVFHEANKPDWPQVIFMNGVYP